MPLIKTKISLEKYGHFRSIEFFIKRKKNKNDGVLIV